MPPEPDRTGVWERPAERLDRVLPALGFARSRTQAAELIAGGGVRVDDAAATKAGARVAQGSRITAPAPDRHVSRAAHKLIAGLDAFGVDPRGRIALDLGASTGGFTQVLLERGARTVLAVDVGHGQLVPELREDPRVRAVEGCNARDLTPESLAAATGVGERPSLVVADLSFISLTLILPAIARCVDADGDHPPAELVLLIKPQFEVGRVRDGIVVRPEQRAEAMRAVVGAAALHGFACRGLVPSPILGGRGNIEYIAGFVADADTVGRAALDPSEWEDRIAELSEGSPELDGARSPGRTEQHHGR